MKLHLLVLVGILIFTSSTASANDEIEKILNIGIRCDNVNWHLYLNVVGKTSNGTVKYIENDIRMLDRNIDIDIEHVFVTKYEKYDSCNYYIIVKCENKKYIIGEMQHLERTYPVVYNVRLNIPWKFNLKTQLFELNYNVKEMPEINGDVELMKNGIVDELKTKALQGDEGAITTLKDRGLWN